MRRSLIPLLALALLVTACGGDDAGTERFTDAATGLSFDYPGAWDRIEGLSMETEVGASDTVSMVALGELDSSSGNLIGVSVQVDDIGPSVADADQRPFLDQVVDPVIADLVAASNGTAPEPTWATVAGRDARHYEITSPVRGQELFTDLTVLVRGNRLYKVYCQAEAGEFEGEIAEGCALVLDTFDLG